MSYFIANQIPESSGIVSDRFLHLRGAEIVVQGLDAPLRRVTPHQEAASLPRLWLRSILPQPKARAIWGHGHGWKKLEPLPKVRAVRYRKDCDHFHLMVSNYSLQQACASTKPVGHRFCKVLGQS